MSFKFAPTRRFKQSLIFALSLVWQSHAFAQYEYIVALKEDATFGVQFQKVLSSFTKEGATPTEKFIAFGKNYLIVNSKNKNLLELFDQQKWAKLGISNLEKNISYSVLRGSRPPEKIPDDLHDFNPRPVISNDPDLNKLWGILNFGQSVQGTPGYRKIDSATAQAWNISTGQKEQLVGIMDTGVDYNHPDLNANLWRNKDANGAAYYGYNALADNNDVTDGYGHGTHVSGTIGAVGNNGIGIAGINWNVKMVHVKIFDSSGSTSLSTILKGLSWFNDRRDKIKVINHSWGGNTFSQALSDAFKELDGHGIINVIAAGNSSEKLDRNSDKAISKIYPAMYELENSIVVASFDNKGRLSGFSNYSDKIVDIAAPGTGIYSTVPDGYAYKSGTSMATPHVTGAISLLWSQHPSWTASMVKSRLLDQASVWSSLDGVTINSKALNVYNAL